MTNILIVDLVKKTELDQNAMSTIVGGYKLDRSFVKSWSTTGSTDAVKRGITSDLEVWAWRDMVTK